MARATYVPKVPLERDVELTLTAKEASVLKAFTGRVTGPDEGPRGQVEAIWTALKILGVQESTITSEGTFWIE